MTLLGRCLNAALPLQADATLRSLFYFSKRAHYNEINRCIANKRPSILAIKSFEDKTFQRSLLQYYLCTCSKFIGIFTPNWLKQMKYRVNELKWWEAVSECLKESGLWGENLGKSVIEHVNVNYGSEHHLLQQSVRT